MPFNGRLLVGQYGQPDWRLVGYAAMVCRLGQPLALNGAETHMFLGAETATRTRGDGSRRRSRESSGPSNGDAQVRFVTLLPPSTKRVGSRTARAERAVLRAQVQEFLAGFSEWANVSCDVLRGNAADRLAALAADFDSDLVLVGENGWPLRQRIRLAMEAPCSTWFVPAGWAPVLRRILVPIDFTDRSAECLQAAVDLARRFPPAVCLALHVDRHDTRCSGDEIEPSRRSELMGDFKTMTAAINAANVRIVPLLVKGHRLEGAIARAADQQAVDLIVMATRGRSPATGRVLPSATEAVLPTWPGAMLVLKSSGAAPTLRDALLERWARADDVQFS
jgi:nucleotide-binding universal stress UspA family protein